MNHRQTDKAPTSNRHVGLPSNRQTAPIGGAVSVTGRGDGGTDNRQAENSDPLATPGLLRILLGKTASDRLATAGEFFLIEATRSPIPEHAGRFIAYALPISKAAADAAARVAKGTHRAVRISTPQSPQ